MNKKGGIGRPSLPVFRVGTAYFSAAAAASPT